MAKRADRNVVQMEADKEAKIQEFMYGDKTNVERAMYDCTGNKWSHQNGDARFKGGKKFGSRKQGNIQ